MTRSSALPGLCLLILAVTGCNDAAAPGTPTTGRVLPPERPVQSVGSGFTQTSDARANLGDFHVQSKFNGFEIELKSHDNTDIEVSTQVGAAGGSTGGWHYHPGPVLVLIKSGVGTLYDANGLGCTMRTFPAGSVFIEGTNPHTLRNEGAVPLEITAVFFVPIGVPRRIEAGVPANCPP